MSDDNPYLLLTPGPLSTSSTVRQAMLKDWCTWDSEYNDIVQSVRRDLLTLAFGSETESVTEYTTVLMQGSGTASVEATLGTALSYTDKLLIVSNGAYGERMAEIARYLNIQHIQIAHDELEALDLERIESRLQIEDDITHICVVHCETTSGRLNPIAELGKLAQKYGCCYIVDAMSSFGGIEINFKDIGIDFLISSANKCIHGVPGFGFVIAKRSVMETLSGRARSLSLDLYSQWKTMEDHHGKWRFTSPTHVVRAFRQALDELLEEGLKARHQRYQSSQECLQEGMHAMGFRTMVEREQQSPFITSFYYPENFPFNFKDFYLALKQQGFVIYPGKVSNADCFRIGNIGEVYPSDIRRLLDSIADTLKNSQAEVSHYATC